LHWLLQEIPKSWNLAESFVSEFWLIKKSQHIFLFLYLRFENWIQVSSSDFQLIPLSSLYNRTKKSEIKTKFNIHNQLRPEHIFYYYLNLLQ
jgi:hypothetical protein